MRQILFLTTLFFYGFVFAKINPLVYESSLHKLIFSGSENNVKNFTLSFVPPGFFQRKTVESEMCYKNLQHRIQEGSSFESQILKKYLINLSQLPGKNGNDGYFYHHTNSLKILNAPISETFKFFRSGKGRLGPETWQLYVASDTESAKAFGNNRIKIKFRDQTLIFDPYNYDFRTADEMAEVATQPDKYRNDNPRMYNKKIAATDLIEDEIIRRFPELTSCKFSSEYKLDEHLDDYSLLVLLALEANGVDLIAYYGLDPNKGWFQVVGEWSIESVKLDTVISVK